MSSFFSPEKVDWVWRVCLVQLITVFLFFVSFSNIPIHLTEFRIQFFLVAIFYWTIFRPTLLPYLLIFFFGLAQDFILHYPLGFHAAFYLVFQFILRRQRVFLMGQSHFVLWLLFSLSCFSYYMSEWLFFSVLNFQVSSLSTSILSMGLTIVVYPIVSLLFIPFHKILPIMQGAGK